MGTPPRRPSPLENLLTAAEVGALLGVTATTVGRYRRAGKINGVALSASTIRYEPAAVEEFIARRDGPAGAWSGAS